MINIKAIFKIIVIIHCFLTISCSFVSRDQAPVTLAAMRHNVDLEQWQLRGKIGMSNQQQTESAYLNWQQCDELFNIRLSGTFGASGVHVLGYSDHIVWQTNQERIVASTPEQLLHQQTGWQLPVSQLSYWIRGVPDPEQPSYLRDAASFEQYGWSIQYMDAHTHHGRVLPTKITLSDGELNAVIVIQQWQLSPNC